MRVGRGSAGGWAGGQMDLDEGTRSGRADSPNGGPMACFAAEPFGGGREPVADARGRSRPLALVPGLAKIRSGKSPLQGRGSSLPWAPMKRCVRWLGCAAAVTGTMLVAGCGGINATHSVSPASFLLPGLMKVEPPKPAPTAAEAPLGREMAGSASDVGGQP